VIILLLLLALLGGAEDSPNVPGEVVTSEGNEVPPNTNPGLPGPSPSGGGSFQLAGIDDHVRVGDCRDIIYV
jgi:hypothetical protein